MDGIEFREYVFYPNSKYLLSIYEVVSLCFYGNLVARFPKDTRDHAVQLRQQLYFTGPLVL